MTTKKITNTLGTVQTSIESAWNRIVMGVRTRKMPKTIKRVKETFSKGNKHHTGLSANWEPAFRERELGMLNQTTFYSQYMGSTLVEELVNPEPGANYQNTGLSTKALDRIIRMSRNKTLVSVSVSVSPSGIHVTKQSDRSTVLDIPMERVSFSTNDKKYSKVTAFMAKNYVNETMECHAFLCHRQKMAKAIADAFSTAYTQSKELKSQQDNSEEGITQDQTSAHSTGDESSDGLITDFENLDTKFVDCENNESIPQVQLREKSYNKVDVPISEPEVNHNLLELSTDAPPPIALHQRHTTPDFLIDDNEMEPVMRARADSDSWAVMATGTNDNSNDDLELEFSNFARSRSTTNLADLHTSVHSAWDI